MANDLYELRHSERTMKTSMLTCAHTAATSAGLNRLPPTMFRQITLRVRARRHEHGLELW